MENLYGYGGVQTLIDMVGFYGGNMVVSKATSMSKPKMDETLIFGISDLLIRNAAVTYFSENSMFQGNLGKNAYIGVVSFLLTTGYDLLKEKDLSSAIKDNLIKNAVGVATNTGIDMVITKKNI